MPRPSPTPVGPPLITDEYWAEGAQAYFDATVRTDVTSGITSRDQLWKVDPGLARLLEAAFGSGPWRYPLDAQGCLCKQRPPNGDAPPNPDAWRADEQEQPQAQQQQQQEHQLEEQHPARRWWRRLRRRLCQAA